MHCKLTGNNRNSTLISMKLSTMSCISDLLLLPQEEAAEWMLKRRGRGLGGFLNLECGFGKNFVIMQFLSELSRERKSNGAAADEGSASLLLTDGSALVQSAPEEMKLLKNMYTIEPVAKYDKLTRLDLKDPNLLVVMSYSTVRAAHEAAAKDKGLDDSSNSGAAKLFKHKFPTIIAGEIPALQLVTG